MSESITFTWSDVHGEARPSPTTKKRLDEWSRDAKEANRNLIYKLDIYQLNFLSDVITELTYIYDEILTKEKE
tara:strand:- start:3566 stop:3784 length:219 start_codon:yes stop_codon:yes gene_type:complete